LIRGSGCATNRDRQQAGVFFFLAPHRLKLKGPVVQKLKRIEALDSGS